MKISLWPAWLPHPISCLKGFVLSYTFSSTVKSYFPLQSGDSLVPILIGAWIWVALLFGFLHWVFTAGANLLLRKMPQKHSFDNFRQHLTTWSSFKKPHWKEGLNAFIISFVTSISVAFVVFLIIPAPSRVDAYNSNSYELRQTMIQVRFGLIPIGMTIFSAYLYQYDLWARRRRAAKQERRSQNSTAPVTNSITPNPIEQELNQLKAQPAMSRMNARLAPPNPEIPEWYVFRSGKAEGPYSKLQLWEVQKITERTKVRRGEADWQQAGEIPELAKYLSEK